MTWAYYNEMDPFAADWLLELIKDGWIAPGEVDRRDIKDVRPDDLRPFRQCHFFAGIGVWSLAARQAGIPDDAPLWSGSCPCQPFSQAGGGAGFADERHLWPAFHYLIEQQAPAVVVGEQVAGAGGDAWIDLVSADLDATGYAFGVAETVAAGFGAPHERSRNYWVALADLARPQGRADPRSPRSRDEGGTAERGRPALRLGDPLSGRLQGRRPEPELPLTGQPIEDGLVDHPLGNGCESGRHDNPEHDRLVADPASKWTSPLANPVEQENPAAPLNGIWRSADWLLCRDEKWRPVEPGTFPLADAGTFRNRVGLLRGAGNAITLGQAEGFLRAVRASIR